MAELKPNIPIRMCRTVETIPLDTLKRDLRMSFIDDAGVVQGEVIGDDGLPLTTEQILEKIPAEAMMLARQQAAEAASYSMANFISHQGAIVEDGEPEIVGPNMVSRFKLAVVMPDESGAYPFDRLLDEAFDRGLAAARDVVAGDLARGTYSNDVFSTLLDMSDKILKLKRE